MNPLTIVVATDDHYMVLLAALIKSIEAHLKTGQKVSLYIIENKVRKKSKTKLENSINKDIVTFFWIKSTEIVPVGTKLPIDKSTYPLIIYLRLFIPHFIPKEIERVLYLDIDMIVLRDITELFESEIGNNIVAAVSDPNKKTFDSREAVKNFKELGLSGDSHYFNSGLLLMDTKKWRDANITENTIECIDQNKDFANYPDQYGLNVVLANKWFELDSRWNHYSTIECSDPFLIHFVHRKPIYKSYQYNVEYKDKFYFYLSQTKWKNFRPIGEFKRYLKKINNILEKMLPKNN